MKWANHSSVWLSTVPEPRKRAVGPIIIKFSGNIWVRELCLTYSLDKSEISQNVGMTSIFGSSVCTCFIRNWLKVYKTEFFFRFDMKNMAMHSIVNYRGRPRDISVRSLTHRDTHAWWIRFFMGVIHKQCRDGRG